MKCVIPRSHIKIFARALHSLAKIGEDLHLDGRLDGLICSTINSSRSAFATYTFKTGFFTEYHNEEEEEEEEEERAQNEIEEEEDGSKCKVAMKGAVWVFKSISQLEKTVETAEITLVPLESKLKVRLNCKFSVSKTYTLPFLECEPLKANYDASQAKNKFSAQAKVLSEAFKNFLANQEEVTMIAEDDKFVLKNYIDVYDVRNADNDPVAGKGAVHTVLTMQPETDFERYEIKHTSSTGVTFCLKEFRAILTFADAFAMPISASFDDSGQPIIFSLKCPQSFEASLVMATMADGEAEDAAVSASPAVARNNHQATSSTQRGRRASNGTNCIEAVRQRLNADGDNGDDDESPRSSSGINGNPRNSTMARLSQSMMLPPSATPILLPDAADNVYNPGGGNDVRNLNSTQPPPSKKRRTFFRRCFDSTFNPNEVTAAQRILAPDSDDEEADGN